MRILIEFLVNNPFLSEVRFSNFSGNSKFHLHSVDAKVPMSKTSVTYFKILDFKKSNCC